MSRLEDNLLKEFATKNNLNLSNLIKEKENGKPVDKIIGERGFYKHDFIVSEDVLTPRPDTECLVEDAINFAFTSNAKSILDLGLGSGCILLSILADVKNLNGIGVDISEKALNIAKQNAQKLNLLDRTEFINASWFDLQVNKKFDIITSNPPYIKSDVIPTLDIGVKKYDPMLALDGGEDGLRDYRQIAKIAKNLLNENGRIYLEIGYDQNDDVIKIFSDYKLIKTIKDLSGINRCLVFKIDN
ncbi:MAG: peptide chain release factor N(5)-glutamine methyltransferase [Alphaproteobacteria bacterium]